MQHLTPENTTWHELYDMLRKEKADNTVLKYQVKSLQQTCDIQQKALYKGVK